MKPASAWSLFGVLGACAQIALADHGADPARELPIWLLVAVAVLVGLAFAAVSAVRKRSRRRPKSP
ncbi:MAG: hypothetical protein OEZ08_12000 [Betaproteobacteria bacterium]|nr:hypothetical protein [Betaproteobacteria bacterium]